MSFRTIQSGVESSLFQEWVGNGGRGGGGALIKKCPCSLYIGIFSFQGIGVLELVEGLHCCYNSSHSRFLR